MTGACSWPSQSLWYLGGEMCSDSSFTRSPAHRSFHSVPCGYWSGLDFLCSLPRGPEQRLPLCYLGVSCPSVATCVRESALPRGMRGPSLDSCPLAAWPHSCLRPTTGQEAACCPTPSPPSGRDPSPVVGGSSPPGLMSRGCQPWTPRALFCQAHLEACPGGASGTYTHGARAAPWHMHPGTCTLVHAPWHTHPGTHTLAHAPWHTHPGTRTLAHAPWHTHPGTCNLVHGPSHTAGSRSEIPEGTV